MRIFQAKMYIKEPFFFFLEKSGAMVKPHSRLLPSSLIAPLLNPSPMFPFCSDLLFIWSSFNARWSGCSVICSHFMCQTRRVRVFSLLINPCFRSGACLGSSCFSPLKLVLLVTLLPKPNHPPLLVLIGKRRSRRRVLGQLGASSGGLLPRVCLLAGMEPALLRPDQQQDLLLGGDNQRPRKRG